MKRSCSENIVSDEFESPRKRRRISPIIVAPLSDNENENENDNNSDSSDDDIDGSYYSLHLNHDIILSSSSIKHFKNVNWKYEDEDEPNLFTVTKHKISNNDNNNNNNSDNNDTNDNIYDSNKLLLKHSNDIEYIANLLLNANSNVENKVGLLIVTGAGMGCDSGLPDYRSKNGFWKDYPPFRRVLKLEDINNQNNNLNNENNENNDFEECSDRLTLHEMSKSDWFLNDPLFAWGFYSHRTQLYKNATPHKGFNILYNICNHYFPNNYMYTTSNIDDQVLKAGFLEDRIWQTHGSLGYIQCVKNCDNSKITKFINNISINKRNFRVINKKDIPKCLKCKCLQRPNVSFFSDDCESFNDQRCYIQKLSCLKFISNFTNYYYIKYKENNKTNQINGANIIPNIININNNNKENNENKIDNIEELIVIEIGCGTSVHSLRWEVEYLKIFPNVTVIRINPSLNAWKIDNNDILGWDNSNCKFKRKRKTRHVGLKLRAQDALVAIDSKMKELMKQKSPKINSLISKTKSKIKSKSKSKSPKLKLKLKHSSKDKSK